MRVKKFVSNVFDRFCLILFTILLSLQVNAQEYPLKSVSSTMLGIGRSNQLDTYLSPIEYTGPQVTLFQEYHRPLHRNRKVSFGSLLQLNGSAAGNWNNTTDLWAGDIHYDATWQYRWKIKRICGLTLTMGGGAGITIGGVYSPRGGNNPANAHAQIRLLAAIGADYHFHLWKRDWCAGYHLDAPLLGAMFSPQYGQSYYEIFDRNNYDHNVVLTHLVNCTSLRQRLMLDIPVSAHGTMLRMGYLSDIRQARPNHLKQHQISRSFLIGVVRTLKGRK